LPRNDDKARVAALQRLRAVTGELSTRWVLCGDFNTPAASWLADDRDVVVAPIPAVATYPADDPVEAIDYCLASPDVSLDVKVMDASGSDHLAVLVSASLPDVSPSP
jgi:endonuclease/exonuclease/phosphatase family metal-dependent hydrolase